MKLFYFPVAPNPTRVRLYLTEKAEAGIRIPLEAVAVDVRKGVRGVLTFVLMEKT